MNNPDLETILANLYAKGFDQIKSLNCKAGTATVERCVRYEDVVRAFKPIQKSAGGLFRHDK